jgi:hypothetical protein
MRSSDPQHTQNRPAGKPYNSHRRKPPVLQHGFRLRCFSVGGTLQATSFRKLFDQLKQSLEMYDFYTRQIEACGAEIKRVSHTTHPARKRPGR